MTTQTPDSIPEGMSRLEGAYEQVNERLRDLAEAVSRVEARLNALIAVIGAVGIAIAVGIVLLALRVP